MKPYKRSVRVAGLIYKEISLIMSREMAERGFGMVSFTSAKLTDDLAQATVFVSSLAESELQKEAVAYLNRHRARIRGQLARRVTMRSIPEIFFEFDPSIEEGMRIEVILERLQKERNESERETE